MQLIGLTQGQMAIVDDSDYEELSKYLWYARWHPGTQSYYARRDFLKNDKYGKSTSMSRFLLGLKRGDKRQGDHINHDTLDHRRCNLRMVTFQQNMDNRRIKAKGYKKTSNGKYQAGIKVRNKIISLGTYNTRKEAHQAYLKARHIHQPFRDNQSCD